MVSVYVLTIFRKRNVLILNSTRYIIGGMLRGLGLSFYLSHKCVKDHPQQHSFLANGLSRGTTIK